MVNFCSFWSVKIDPHAYLIILKVENSIEIPQKSLSQDIYLPAITDEGYRDQTLVTC